MSKSSKLCLVISPTFYLPKVGYPLLVIDTPYAAPACTDYLKLVGALGCVHAWA